MKLATIILAAGKGTRMKSPYPKVLHLLAGEPMVVHVLETARTLSPDRILVVVGYKAELVREALRNYPVEFVEQKEQLGTGDAVRRCEGALADFSGEILVLCGDVPLLRPETLEGLLAEHRRRKAVVTVLTAEVEDPFGYGRIVRDERGLVRRIVEEKDASEKERAIKEVNSGTYVFQADYLFSALKEIRPENVQKEYYLTDVVEIAVNRGLPVAAHRVPEATEILGVNSQEERARVEGIFQDRLRKKFMKEGVTLILPETVYLERRVRIEPGATIFPHVVLRGETRIGPEAKVLSFCYLEDVEVGPGAEVGPGLRLKGWQVPPGTRLIDWGFKG
ncbi:MAG: bifunctional N-acetylglucosamine-1-phosphate uridyltransferase/glucosamine-1-phosphate acetyltransferase [Thermodesulfobacteria bacterium]|nr:bifunctional N-acetylglucosamine-1-phosphate uridyltransferase/glucosamine-1-phosphate acetyltransferase [Thermodesulfobacteriota bacterium]